MIRTEVFGRKKFLPTASPPSGLSLRFLKKTAFAFRIIPSKMLDGVGDWSFGEVPIFAVGNKRPAEIPGVSYVTGSVLKPVASWTLPVGSRRPCRMNFVSDRLNEVVVVFAFFDESGFR